MCVCVCVCFPRLSLTVCLSPGPGPPPSLTKSSLSLPTGAQGRSWGKEGRFLQSEERGKRKALCPGAHRALPGIKTSRLRSISSHLLWGPSVGGIMPVLWGLASLNVMSSSLTPVAAHREHRSSQGQIKLHCAHAFTVHTPSLCSHLHCAHPFTVLTPSLRTRLHCATSFTVFTPSSLKHIRVVSTSVPF